MPDDQDMENIEIPSWVAARLRQENPDVAKAIADLVIWADKAKMWMYQADADFEKIVGQLENDK